MARIVSLDALVGDTQELRAQGKRIVLTNGAFDLLHVGHVRYLQAAKAFGDVLVVAVNSDASVKRAKGPQRPVVSESERAELVSALACVDYVTVFSDDTVVPIIRALKPDVHAKGTDYTEESVPERDEVIANGGIVKIAGDPKNHSTTALVDVLKTDVLKPDVLKTDVLKPDVLKPSR
jgi:rfaE bifunctional protein nucleotidyltransferase chain/domain